MSASGASSSPAPVRIAVFGAGGMGRNHIRLLHALDGVDLVAVCDPDPAALARLSRTVSVRAYTNHFDLLATEILDAAAVVVPTSLHFEVVMALLARGVHVLVEKPIAGTSSEGRLMVREAARYGLLLTVGHVERFNPAVIELERQLAAGAAGQIFQLKARRTGPFPARIRDVGVVIDLATHDLDLILSLSGSLPNRIYAETERNIHTAHEDMLLALLRLENGMTAHLDINWLSPFKTRELVVTGERGSFVVDALSRQLYFYENGLAAGTGQHGMEEGRMIKYLTPNIEPLQTELEVFVAAVRGERRVAVSGEDALRALMVAEAVLESAATHRVIDYSPLGGAVAAGD